MRAPTNWKRRKPVVLVSCQYCTFMGRRAGTGPGPRSCPACGGSHWVLVYVDRHDFARPCEVCEGKGTEIGRPDRPCPACSGCGWAERAELTFETAPSDGPMPTVR
jgi:molecular chaperone DnaJ